MYARLVSGRLKTEMLDDAIQLWRESVAPSARRITGFHSARLMVDRKTGKVVSLGLWEKEADYRNSANWNSMQLEKFASMFIDPPAVDGYEVAAETSSSFA